MSLRSWINNNSAVVTILAVLFLCAALWIVISNANSGRPKMATQQWYYDLAKGERFAGKIGMIPPFDHEGGKENGVVAYIYSCGDCGSDWHIAWFQKFSPADKRRQEEFLLKQQQNQVDGKPASPMGFSPLMGGSMAEPLVSQPDPQNLQWVPMTSAQAQTMIHKVRESCGDATKSTFKFCQP